MSIRRVNTGSSEGSEGSEGSEFSESSVLQFLAAHRLTSYILHLTLLYIGIGGKDAELLFEAFGKVAWGSEAYAVGYFGNGGGFVV